MKIPAFFFVQLEISALQRKDRQSGVERSLNSVFFP